MKFARTYTAVPITNLKEKSKTNKKSKKHMAVQSSHGKVPDEDELIFMLIFSVIYFLN